MIIFVLYFKNQKYSNHLIYKFGSNKHNSYTLPKITMKLQFIMMKPSKQIQIIFKSIQIKVNSYLILANSLLQLKQIEAAIECIEIANQRSPNNPLVYLAKGSQDLNFQRKTIRVNLKLEEALEVYSIAIRHSKYSQDTATAKAKLLYKLNKFDEAINTINEAIGQDPYNYNLILFKVKLLISMNKYEEAQIYVQDVKEFDKYLIMENLHLQNCENQQQLKSSLSILELDTIQQFYGYELYFLKCLNTIQIIAFALNCLLQFEDAIECYNQAILKFPNYKQVYLQKGMYLNSLYKFEQAISCDDYVIDNFPVDSLVYLKKGQCLISQYKLLQALQLYDEAMQKLENNIEIVIAKAQLLEKTQQFEDTFQCYSLAVKLYPYNFESYYYQGDFLIKENKHIKAIESYKNALKFSPNIHQIYYKIITSLIAVKKTKEALQLFKEASLKFPYEFDLQIKLLKQILTFIDLFEAIELENLILRIDQNNFLPYLAKGILLSYWNHNKEASDQIDQAIKLNKYFSYSYIEKNILLKHDQNNDEALQILDQAINIDPYNSQNYLSKVHLDVMMHLSLNTAFYRSLYDDSNLDQLSNSIEFNDPNQKLVEYYDQFLKLNPYQVEYYCRKGQRHFINLRYEEALKCYDAAIEINPYYIQAYIQKGNMFKDIKANYLIKNNNYKMEQITLNNIGKKFLNMIRYQQQILKTIQFRAKKVNQKFNEKALSLAHRGKLEEGIECLDESIKLSCTNLHIYIKKAELLNTFEKNEEAIKCYDDAIQAQIHDPQIYLNKGTLLLHENRVYEAIQSYNMILAQFPEVYEGLKSKAISLYLQQDLRKVIQYMRLFSIFNTQTIQSIQDIQESL